MNNLRVIFLVLLVAGLFAGVIASQAADSGVTPWPSTAEKIRKGEIDVGRPSIAIIKSIRCPASSKNMPPLYSPRIST